MKSPDTDVTLESHYGNLTLEGASAFLAEAGTFGKQAYRAAFDGTWQPFGPFEAADGASLRQLVSDLVVFSRSAIEEKKTSFILGFSANLAAVGEATAKGIHSHPGKYIHASSGASWTVRPGNCQHPYLTSASAGHQRWLSAGFVHLPAAAKPGRLFIAQFMYSGRITSVAELLSEENVIVTETLSAHGVAAADIQSLQSKFKAAFNQPTQPLESNLPQLLWPLVDGTYVALTGLPALSVYNALVDMRHLAASASVEGDSPKGRIPWSSYAVGSGQAQNISVAATSTSGHIGMLICVPPEIRYTRANKLLRLAVGNRLVVKLKGKALASFDRDISPLPNRRKSEFFKKHATAHVLIAMERVRTLQIALRENARLRESVPESLSDELKAVVLREADERLSSEVVQRLVVLILESGVAPVLVKHTPNDRATYEAHLRAALNNIG